jgi:hypothetical protein
MLHHLILACRLPAKTQIYGVRELSLWSTCGTMTYSNVPYTLKGDYVFEPPDNPGGCQYSTSSARLYRRLPLHFCEIPSSLFYIPVDTFTIESQKFLFTAVIYIVHCFDNILGKQPSGTFSQQSPLLDIKTSVTG